MDRNDALNLGIRLRRSTTNRDAIAICDALMEELTKTTAIRKRAANGTFDRKAYQRDYMRKYRVSLKQKEQT